jgi:hypothetical protein
VQPDDEGAPAKECEPNPITSHEENASVETSTEITPEEQQQQGAILQRLSSFTEAPLSHEGASTRGTRESAASRWLSDMTSVPPEMDDDDARFRQAMAEKPPDEDEPEELAPLQWHAKDSSEAQASPEDPSVALPSQVAPLSAALLTKHQESSLVPAMSAVPNPQVVQTPLAEDLVACSAAWLRGEVRHLRDELLFDIDMAMTAPEADEEPAAKRPPRTAGFLSSEVV